MDDPHDEAEKLAIRCPGCGQRFKVGTELRDRMVECGTCEHRFRVNEEVIVRSKKFYPGERPGRSLERFSRVPKTIASAQTTFQTVQYNEEPAHSAFEPTSPLRLIFGFIAVSVAIIIALMLVFGGSPGGVLFGTSQSKRLMLAGFTAIVSGTFLILANPRNRAKAIFGAVATSAALLGLPFIFIDGNQPVTSVTDIGGIRNPGKTAAPDEVEAPVEDDEFALLKKEIGYDPLEREIGRYGKEAGTAGRGVMGIWLRGLQEIHKFQVRDYIIRNTGAEFSSHMYQRDDGYLMVVTGVVDDFAEMARLCQSFGEARIIDSLRVIEVQVDNEAFLEGAHDKLTDMKNPAFYELNRRELESIDLERALKAVLRLAAAEPKLYRDDIVKRMQDLIREGDIQLQGEVGTALLVWGQPGDGSEKVVRDAVLKIAATGKEVPESLVELLVTRKDLAVIPIIDDMWARDSTTWEDLYSAMGPAIEDAVLARFEKGTVILRMSAIQLLGKIGSAKSLPVLEGAREAASPEVRVLLDRAIASIRSRG
ncbi:MAG: hypothetical protein B9S38_11550 [Verrucomicrobiia bacterium Tous-C4TDCM]|nr:MAG: hypothetical protein B9S38_11550 [Verrucomicrobiae bacterium Tous-C4TDCM]